MKAFLLIGTRPQIIKSASIIHEVTKSNSLKLEVIHTGQHYDYEMSRVFFDQLELPDPIINLDVGSGSHAYQTAGIMTKLEKVLIENRPDCIIVPGDTNSALASALTSVKLGITIAHIEAGARSYDMLMAEEINRRVIDTISSILFAVSEACASNLKDENVPGRIFVSGDTMYDIYLLSQDKISQSKIIKKIGLERCEYCILTLHRAENVDSVERLIGVLSAIKETCSMNHLKVIFPMHPRTKKVIESIKFPLEEVVSIEPLGYIDTMKLLKEAKFVMTDSGGFQKEAFWSKVPCITLRDRTEWMETVKLGSNILSGNKKESITKAIEKLLVDYDRIKDNLLRSRNPYGDGKASAKIIKAIESIGHL